VHPHQPLVRSQVPGAYQVNREIANLAAQFSKARRGRNGLPPLALPSTAGSPVWPSTLPVYVISINPVRRAKFQSRFAHPSTVWEGTIGKTLDLGRLKREGLLMSSHMTRGEIGCYDSHLRLCNKLARETCPLALLCEDDVALTGDAAQSRYLNTLLEELRSVPFDVLFVSWFRPTGGKSLTPHTRQQWCFNQLWAYVVSREGLRKMCADPKLRKMHVPVDVALWDAHARGVLRNVVAYPPLCLTVGEHSDTRGIR